MNNVRKQGEQYGLVIGCGKERKESTADMKWLNVDADSDVNAEIRTPVHRLHERFVGFFDRIEAKDILEHIPYTEENQEQWLRTLQSWSWCLARGGTLFVQVPDIEAILKQYHEKNIDHVIMNRVIFGENTGELDRHYQMFTLRSLRQAMIDLGLEVVEAYNLHVCAIVVGKKP